jgi:hypothetical protein
MYQLASVDHRHTIPLVCKLVGLEVRRDLQLLKVKETKTMTLLQTRVTEPKAHLAQQATKIPTVNNSNSNLNNLHAPLTLLQLDLPRATQSLQHPMLAMLHQSVHVRLSSQ